MFNKEVEVLEKENKIIITVSGEKRKFITEERHVFREDVVSLIPEQYKDKISLLSKPDKYIANFESKKYGICGEWVYEIKQEEKKQATRRRARKKQPTTKTQTEEQNSEKTDRSEEN